MVRMAFAALALGALVVAPAVAADTKPAGTWTRSSNGIDVTIAFDKEIVITVTVGDGTAIVTNSYTTDADGTLKLKVTKAETKGNFPDKPAVGLETSFKWTAEGKTAKLADFKGVDDAKDVLEGEYLPKK